MTASRADLGGSRPIPRERFIPVRKTDIVGALGGLLSPEVERKKFVQLCRLLGAIYHNEYFDRLELLRDDYYYFNPELDPHARFDESRREQAYAELMGGLEAVMKAADFVEVSHAEIEQAHREHPVLRVNVKSPLNAFRSVRFFRRGQHSENFQIVDRFGLRKRQMTTEIHDDVVLLVATKSAQEAGEEAKSFARSKLRPGAVLLKHFRNIATADLNALYPNVSVVLSVGDKLVLGVPALIGLVPIALKLAATLTVLFVIIGAYLGYSGAVAGDKLQSALGAISALLAFGGFVTLQWAKYQSQSLKYQKLLADNVYFRNINNNAGIFDYVIGSAEETETKEVALAYYFLLKSNPPPTGPGLGAAVEAWLDETFGVDVDFPVAEAIRGLERLGLLVRQGETLSVLPLDLALARLDTVWADFHRDEGATGKDASRLPASR